MNFENYDDDQILKYESLSDLERKERITGDLSNLSHTELATVELKRAMLQKWGSYSRIWDTECHFAEKLQIGDYGEAYKQYGKNCFDYPECYEFKADFWTPFFHLIKPLVKATQKRRQRREDEKSEAARQAQLALERAQNEAREAARLAREESINAAKNERIARETAFKQRQELAKKRKAEAQRLAEERKAQQQAQLAAVFPPWLRTWAKHYYKLTTFNDLAGLVRWIIIVLETSEEYLEGKLTIKKIYKLLKEYPHQSYMHPSYTSERFYQRLGQLLAQQGMINNKGSNIGNIIQPDTLPYFRHLFNACVSYRQSQYRIANQNPPKGEVLD